MTFRVKYDIIVYVGERTISDAGRGGPMHTFEPDYRNLQGAARNVECQRIPLYEHIIASSVLEAILGRKFAHLAEGDEADRREYFRVYAGFLRDHGYDVVPYECCITDVLPGGGALGRHVQGIIRAREDFDRYPWKEIPDLFFRKFSPLFQALRQTMPPGMMAVGGVGNGVFECVQDLTGYIDLCYMREDDPELYRDMFRAVGDMMAAIWTRFLREFGDIYCVLRFGDDLGFATGTLLIPDDIRSLVIPRYKVIIDKVHAAGKPFLLHSCGHIFDVMEDLIAAGIDAKHSNEDKIAPFPEWVERYGDRIGNFGGIDMNCLCEMDRAQMREYIEDVVRKCRGRGGFAFGTGNSIAEYVPPEGYLNMIEIFRELRGETSF